MFSVRWYQIWVGPFLIYWLSVLVIDETLFLFCEILRSHWLPGDSLVSLLQYCAANIIHILFRPYNNILHTRLPSSFKKYFQFSLHCKIPIKGDRDKWHGVFIKSILKQNISAVTRWGRKSVLKINNIKNNNKKITRLRTWGGGGGGGGVSFVSWWRGD